MYRIIVHPENVGEEHFVEAFQSDDRAELDLHMDNIEKDPDHRNKLSSIYNSKGFTPVKEQSSFTGSYFQKSADHVCVTDDGHKSAIKPQKP